MNSTSLEIPLWRAPAAFRSPFQSCRSSPPSHAPTLCPNSARSEPAGIVPEDWSSPARFSFASAPAQDDPNCEPSAGRLNQERDRQGAQERAVVRDSKLRPCAEQFRPATPAGGGLRDIG